MFDKASHAALSGNAIAQDAQTPQDRAERPSRGGGEGGGRGGKQQQRGGAMPEGGAMPGRAGMVAGNADSETTAIAIAAATSTAFWDATLRASPFARSWLQGEATPWLRGIADYARGRPG